MRWYLIECHDAKGVTKIVDAPYPLKDEERIDLAAGVTLFRDAYGRYAISGQALDGSDLPEYLSINGIEKGGKILVSLKKSHVPKRRKRKSKVA
jgi:hypothetical protein